MESVINNKGLTKYCRNSFLSDCTVFIRSLNSYIPSHKIILSSSSQYLKSIFENEKEFPLKVINNYNNVIELPEIIETNLNNSNSFENTEKSFDIFLRYAYSNQNFDLIESSITFENVFKILKMSSLLESEDLNENLANHISKNKLLNEKNCCISLKETFPLKNNHLIEKCIELIKDNFGNSLLLNSERESLLCLPFDLFKRIMESDELAVNTELDCCSLILDYIKKRIIIKEEILISNNDKVSNIKSELKSNEENLENKLQNDENELKPNDNKEEDDVSKKEENLNMSMNNSKLDNDMTKAVENQPLFNNFSNLNQIEENNPTYKKGKQIENWKLSTLISKLNDSESEQLIKLIRFAYLSHKELLDLSSSEIIKNYKDLILEGISFRLNPFESSENLKRYTINLTPRKYKDDSKRVQTKSEKGDLNNKNLIRNKDDPREYYLGDPKGVSELVKNKNPNMNLYSSVNSNKSYKNNFNYMNQDEINYNRNNIHTTMKESYNSVYPKNT